MVSVVQTYDDFDPTLPAADILTLLEEYAQAVRDVSKLDNIDFSSKTPSTHFNHDSATALQPLCNYLKCVSLTNFDVDFHSRNHVILTGRPSAAFAVETPLRQWESVRFLMSCHIKGAPHVYTGEDLRGIALAANDMCKWLRVPADQVISRTIPGLTAFEVTGRVRDYSYRRASGMPRVAGNICGEL